MHKEGNRVSPQRSSAILRTCPLILYDNLRSLPWDWAYLLARASSFQNNRLTSTWFPQSMDIVFGSSAAPIARHLSQRRCHVETTWSRCVLTMVACALMHTNYVLHESTPNRTDSNNAHDLLDSLKFTARPHQTSPVSLVVLGVFHAAPCPKESMRMLLSIAICKTCLALSWFYLVLAAPHGIGSGTLCSSPLRPRVFSLRLSPCLPSAFPCSSSSTCTCACLLDAACFDCSCLLHCVCVFSFRPSFGFMLSRFCQFDVNSFPLFPICA